MPVIKTMIAVLAVMFALTVMPKSSAATSSATDPEQPWGEFSFGATGSFAAGCIGCDVSSGGNSFYLGTPPWTFTGSGFLIVQDAFQDGDQFRVFDNAISIGDTASVPIGSDFCDDPEVCFANLNFSHGVFALGSGDHSFTIQAIASPRNGGAAFLCVSSSNLSCLPITDPGPGPAPTPEPASMLLLGLGLIGALYWSKRRQLDFCSILTSNKRPRR